MSCLEINEDRSTQAVFRRVRQIYGYSTERILEFYNIFFQKPIRVLLCLHISLASIIETNFFRIEQERQLGYSSIKSM